MLLMMMMLSHGSRGVAAVRDSCDSPAAVREGTSPATVLGNGGLRGLAQAGETSDSPHALNPAAALPRMIEAAPNKCNTAEAERCAGRLVQELADWPTFQLPSGGCAPLNPAWLYLPIMTE